tara:strand:+ start:257 stop:586 length:330 start_codon:yes stop_codon:yes gene_type:complete
MIQLLKEDGFKNRINVVEFVKKTSKLLKRDSSSDAEKIDLLLTALKQIAKGKDGIFGTEDDLIPEEVITEIQHMSKTNLLTDLVTIFIKRKRSAMAELMFCFKCYHALT